MPQYKCHKVVSALKIEAVDWSPSAPNEDSDGSQILTVEEPFAPIRVDYQYVRKHHPEAGGYYVVYQDGYKSFSPAEAFESGYALIDA